MPKLPASQTNSNCNEDEDEDEMEAEYKAEILALEVRDGRHGNRCERLIKPDELASRLNKLH